MRLLAVVLLAALAVDELTELKVQLGARDKWVRKGAVEALAKLDKPEAWELVVRALEDPQGEVSDTAQLELRGLRDPDVIESLYKKEGLQSRDPWVRLRAAEALGRIPAEVDGRALAKQLLQKDPLVRRHLLWSIERQARGGNLGGELDKVTAAVEKVARRDKDGRAAGRAWLALAELDAERCRAAIGDAFAHDDPAVRSAALALVPRLDLPEGLAVEAAADPSRPVRARAIEVLAELGTVGACRALVDRLEAEHEQRLSWRIVDQLRELSGLKHRRDARPWRAWADRLEEGWTPVRAGPVRADEERTLSFVGLPILSERLCLLIDLSGSMWKERDEGKTRKDLVNERMREFLERLPETTEFNVIAYTREPIPWQRKLTPAKPTAIQKALRWFEERDEHGTGNFWDAFLLALEDPRVDTVVMLGDGEPTGGRRFHFELLPDLLDEENLGRHVVVDSIVVGAGRRTEAVWEEIAERTGGRSIAVDL